MAKCVNNIRFYNQDIGLTSNGQVSEEEPAGYERLLSVSGGLVHDVQIRGVEAQGSGRQAIRHQVHPQQLDGDQSLRQPNDGCQENTAMGQNKEPNVSINVES